ncbi:malate synthase G [Roseovarius sp. E0-M6]|uniref:malate synthase G n=1 Tax=Roseovarius sp. E0-M6 TaxID=3127118 RepID=UPI00300FAC2A
MQNLEHSRPQTHGLSIDPTLKQFVEDEVLDNLDISADHFWAALSRIVHEFSPRNRALLKQRQIIQTKIDDWHKAHRDAPHDRDGYKAFLERIGYIVPEGSDFTIETKQVDPEVALVPGPQLVVPSTNARFVLNAANARWGSFYDCLYGSDAVAGPTPEAGFNAGRGARVVARSAVFLDDVFPLDSVSHANASDYRVVDGKLKVDDAHLINQAAFVGYSGKADMPQSILLRNNGLHVELVFDGSHPIGANSPSRLADVVLESAMSAIIDLEDSVACVDAADKVAAYRNWLGLMQGTLEEAFEKAGKPITRRLAADREYTAPDGAPLVLKGRALLLVRNVGHLMTSPAILDGEGNEVFEGLMDAMITVLIAMHDLKKSTGPRNSVSGAIYVVKPKMHGPEEVGFANEVFGEVETALGLPEYTVKLGVMDEERRTSVNLKECIRAAKHRVCFINTGFLDRTGDEIHTSMEAGAFSRKDFIKRKSWITAYENRNVDIGLECGLSGKAQIGKGMWAAPDQMAAMLEQKIEHPRSGASCAWVPSPTAATLHATHYHKVDVPAVQSKLAKGGRRAHVDALLDIPLAAFRNWTPRQIRREVANNAQGILGYVVRWIDQGVGCSKVPDINNVGLMEDRATLRISAQHIANWLHHGVVSTEEVMDIMRQMAEIVDRQNADSPTYKPMAPGFDGIAFKASCDLVFEGRTLPSGYTEPVLHRRRQDLKSQLQG